VKEIERDVTKVLLVGLFGVVAIKLVQNSGGISQIVTSLVGGYTQTLGTLAAA
jgi:uncharacterized membrane protein